ncbi:MAG: DUF4804 domain-containing protein [Planctomycetota bacterium]|nr:MAG: DUF4804 domain-containing protein [Planctomycetota bacterium]
MEACTTLGYAQQGEPRRTLPVPSPSEANRFARVPERADEIEREATSSRPILHARTRGLLNACLEQERSEGRGPAQSQCADLDLPALVSRLLARRPLSFVGPGDAYLLWDGRRGAEGFERSDGGAEEPPLAVARLLSYDEMALAALVGVSTPTSFVNRGEWTNRARPAPAGSYEPCGNLVGLVGARLECPGAMEFRTLLVAPEQNVPARGCGASADRTTSAALCFALFAQAFGLEALPGHEEVLADRSGRFLVAGPGSVFLDAFVCRVRMRLVVELFLLEVDARARRGESLGLRARGRVPSGRWAAAARTGEALGRGARRGPRGPGPSGRLRPRLLLVRSLFPLRGRRRRTVLRRGGNSVRVHFSRRDFAEPLRGSHGGKLLVARCAWDGNAHSGKEFRCGARAASADHAAACRSTIAELQSPDLNPRVGGEATVVWKEPGRAATLESTEARSPSSGSRRECGEQRWETRA